jgi:hypothetical protein
MLQRLHRTRAAAEQRGGLLDAEVGDDPQEEHLTLGRGETAEHPPDLAFRDSRHRLGFGVVNRRK